MFCKKCGAQINDIEKFCANCGTPVEAIEQPQPIAAPPIMPISQLNMDKSTFSTASGASYNYVVLQVTLKEKFFGTGSGNLTQLESAINAQAALGYRLHTISTTTSHSTGLGGGDRIQATMVFEKIQ